MSSESPESPLPVPAKKGTGCGLVAWIVILAIGLIVAAVLIREAKIEQDRQAKAKAERLQVRSQQLSQVGNDVLKAEQLIREGQISRAIDALDAQQSILGNLAAEASSSGDATDAADIVSRREAISGVVTAIKQKQDELQQFAEEQIGGLEKQFPGLSGKAGGTGSATPAATPATPAAGASSSSAATPAPATPAPATPAPTPAAPAPAAPAQPQGGP